MSNCCEGFGAGVQHRLGGIRRSCSQLAMNFEKVSIANVEETFGGRVETNAFKIADAALSGNATEAIRLFRHGFATGIDSVALVAALTMRIRQLAKLFNDRNAPAATLGMQRGKWIKQEKNWPVGRSLNWLTW